MYPIIFTLAGVVIYIATQIVFKDFFESQDHIEDHIFRLYFDINFLLLVFFLFVSTVNVMVELSIFSIVGILVPVYLLILNVKKSFK